MINSATNNVNNMANQFSNMISGVDANALMALNDSSKQEAKNQMIEELNEKSKISFWTHVIFNPLKEGRQLSKLV